MVSMGKLLPLGPRSICVAGCCSTPDPLKEGFFLSLFSSFSSSDQARLRSWRFCWRFLRVKEVLKLGFKGLRGPRSSKSRAPKRFWILCFLGNVDRLQFTEYNNPIPTRDTTRNVPVFYVLIHLLA